MKNLKLTEEKITLKRVIVAFLNIKSKDLETNLHISKSLVSRHLSGERRCPEIDIYIIEKSFGIIVKDYIIDTTNN